MGTKKKVEKIKCIGFGKRLLALLLDGLILSPVFLVPYLLHIKLYDVKYLLIYLIVISISHLYAILCPVFFGGTLGKKIMKMKIVNINGTYISIKQSLIRYSPYLASFLLAIILLVIPQGFVWTILDIISSILSYFVFAEAIALITNSDRRTIHDFMASTYVVENIKA